MNTMQSVSTWPKLTRFPEHGIARAWAAIDVEIVRVPLVTHSVRLHPKGEIVRVESPSADTLEALDAFARGRRACRMAPDVYVFTGHMAGEAPR